MNKKEKAVVDAAKRLARFPWGALCVTQDAPPTAEDTACSLYNRLKEVVDKLDGGNINRSFAENLDISSPCPFCWGIGELKTYLLDQEFNQVSCEECGAKGPVAETKQEAVNLWKNGQVREEA